MSDLEKQIRSGFDSVRAAELKRINERIQHHRDALDHLTRRRAELLGRVEDIFNETPAAEQPGIDALLERIAA